MVHFHIHTDGSDSEEDMAGRRMVVSPIIIRMVWIGLGVFLWTAGIFLIAEAIRTIAKL